MKDRPSAGARFRAWLARRARGLGSRLLLVNAVVLVVPWAGLEYARWHERQLLSSLERDMRDQSLLVGAMLETRLGDGGELADPTLARALTTAARSTRTRIRVIDRTGAAVLDSHADGAPEGPERPTPTILSSVLPSLPSTSATGPLEWVGESYSRDATGTPWPTIPARPEVIHAFDGYPAAFTRVRSDAPQVILFVAEPVRHGDEVIAIVYVTRSTQPVMFQLYRLRTALIKLLALSLAITVLVTLVLAWTITRPLERLAVAARRISSGERDVPVPRVGSGEIREVADAFAAMVDEQNARVRYVSEFTADVAHELKSPLTSIRGAAELLRDGAFEDDAARARFLRNIELDAERLDRLVSRLMELSRIDASTEPLTSVALDEVVAKVVERTDTSEQPVVVSGARGTRVRGRALDLERALLNLVENALRFSPPDASVRVEIAETNDTIEVAVTDEGPGVPADLRSRVFERFFTTDAEREGTGLGLAIVKSVAETCGGSVRLDETERGAKFVLALRPA